jgi:hypothetical protein
MKDRRGPGITMVSTGGGAGAGDAGAPAAEDSASGRWDNGAAWTALPEEREEQTQRHTETAAKMADVRRGNFIIGYPLRTFELRGAS